MSISVINDYTFSEGRIFEVAFNDISKDGLKKDKFQWYLIHKNIRYNLTFSEIVRENNLKYFNCYDLEVVLDTDNLLMWFYNYENYMCSTIITEEKFDLSVVN